MPKRRIRIPQLVSVKTHDVHVYETFKRLILELEKEQDRVDLVDDRVEVLEAAPEPAPTPATPTTPSGGILQLTERQWGTVVPGNAAPIMGNYGVALGLISSNTQSGGLDATRGSWWSLRTSVNTVGTFGGFSSRSTTSLSPPPELNPRWVVRLGPEDYSDRRMWIVLSDASAALGTHPGNDNPDIHYAGFRASTSAGDNNWQCLTRRGGVGGTGFNSGVAVDTTKNHTFMVDLSVSIAKFYIDDVLVGTVEDTLSMPPSGAALDYLFCHTNLLEPQLIRTYFNFAYWDLLHEAP